MKVYVVCSSDNSEVLGVYSSQDKAKKIIDMIYKSAYFGNLEIENFVIDDMCDEAEE